jgi:hypothetical protein
MTTTARLTALEASLARIEAALAAKPAQGRVSTAKAASPAPERTAACVCGATYKRGRLVSEIAANPIGLCGLKGYTAHKQ